VSQSLRKSGRLFQLAPILGIFVATFHRRNPFVNQVVCFLSKDEVFEAINALVGRNPFVNQVVCFTSSYNSIIDIASGIDVAIPS